MLAPQYAYINRHNITFAQWTCTLFLYGDTTYINHYRSWGRQFSLRVGATHGCFLHPPQTCQMCIVHTFRVVILNMFWFVIGAQKKKNPWSLVHAKPFIETLYIQNFVTRHETINSNHNYIIVLCMYTFAKVWTPKVNCLNYLCKIQAMSLTLLWGVCHVIMMINYFTVSVTSWHLAFKFTYWYLENKSHVTLVCARISSSCILK